MHEVSKAIGDNGVLFCEGSKEAINKVMATQQDIDTRYQLSLCLKSFYKGQIDMISALAKAMEKMEFELTSPIQGYSNHLSETYMMDIEIVKKSIQAIQKQKIHLETIKTKYYNQSKIVEKKTLKMRDFVTENNKNLSQEKMNSKCGDLVKQTEHLQFLEENYKDEIERLNELYSKYEKDYQGLILSYSSASKNKGMFIKCIIEKWHKIMKETITQCMSHVSSIEDVFNSFDPNNDKNLLQEEFQNSLHCSFDKEEFMSFNQYKSNNPQLFKDKEKKSSSKTHNWFFNHFSSTFLSTFPSAFNPILTDSHHFDSYSKHLPNQSSIKSVKNDNTIKHFINGIFEPKDINPDQLKTLLDLSEQMKDFPFKFIDYYTHSHIKPNQNIDSVCYYQLTNRINFNHLSNMLNSIIMNINFSNPQDISLIYSIIILGEKTSCKDIFLCAMLSKYRFFQKPEVWVIITQHIIHTSLQRKISQMLSKDNKIKSRLIELSNYLDKNEPHLFEDLDLDHDITEYHQLDSKQKHLINNELKGDIHIGIKTAISHYANYHFELKDSLDLIDSLCLRYKLSEEHKTFFKVYLNTSNHSIKKHVTMNRDFNYKEKDNATSSLITNSINLEQIEDINALHSSHIQLLENSSMFGIVKDNSEDIERILPSCLEFITLKDYMSILLINKRISKGIRTAVYKHVLFNMKDISVERHISIWTGLLHIDVLKKDPKNDYQTLVQGLIDMENSKEHEVIEADAKRSFFKTNSNNGRLAIARILHCLSNLRYSKDYEYFQGMNYIAAFIYDLVKDESKAFYFLLALLVNTEMNKLFIDDLKQLKTFFYVLDRLLFLYLPELNTYLHFQGLPVNLFSSPWLITLFTNVYPYLVKDDIPQVLLHIWDIFLIKGWKGIISSFIAIVKYNTNEILKSENEDLLQLLINDFAKSDLFHSDHLLILQDHIKSIKLTRSLIKRIEEEYYLEKSIQESQLIHHIHSK